MLLWGFFFFRGICVWFLFCSFVKGCYGEVFWGIVFFFFFLYVCLAGWNCKINEGDGCVVLEVSIYLCL